MLNGAVEMFTLSYVSYNIVISIVLMVLIINSLQTPSNKFKFLQIFSTLIILIYINFWTEIQTQLLIFLILTELTSLYLVLIMTLNFNQFKTHKTNVYSYSVLLLLCVNYSYIYNYEYFNYYTINYTNPFMYFLLILNPNIVFLLVYTIVFLTMFVLLFLSQKYRTNSTNILMLWSAIGNYINQIPSNINLFSNPFLMKWK